MRVRLLDRVALESDLRVALETRRAPASLPARGHRLRREPGRGRGAGALASTRRAGSWRPVEFIPVAEESDLIVILGAWVIEEACEQIRRWREAHPAQLGVRVSVNVSARQLSPALVDTVAAALERERRPAISARARDHREPADRAHGVRARGAGGPRAARRVDRARRLRHRLFVARLPQRVSAQPTQARPLVHLRAGPRSPQRQDRRRHDRHGSRAGHDRGGRGRRDRRPARGASPARLRLRAGLSCSPARSRPRRSSDGSAAPTSTTARSPPRRHPGQIHAPGRAARPDAWRTRTGGSRSRSGGWPAGCS